MLWVVGGDHTLGTLRELEAGWDHTEMGSPLRKAVSAETPQVQLPVEHLY